MAICVQQYFLWHLTQELDFMDSCFITLPVLMFFGSSSIPVASSGLFIWWITLNIESI